MKPGRNDNFRAFQNFQAVPVLFYFESDFVEVYSGVILRTVMDNNIIILAFSHKQEKKCCPYQINFQNKLRVDVVVFHSVHCTTRKVFLRIPGKNCDVTLTALNLHTDVCEKLLEKKTCACKIDHLPPCKGNINVIHTVVLATIQIVTKECRISVRGETLYLTMLSAVTPTQ